MSEFAPIGSTPDVQYYSPTFKPSASEFVFAPDPQRPWISGESWFEKLMDTISVPQQMVFGLLTREEDTDESLWQSAARGAKENLTGIDVITHAEGKTAEEADTADIAIGTAITFVGDPLNFVPAKWGKQILAPVRWGIKKVSAPISKFLGKHPAYVRMAQALNKNSFASDDLIEVHSMLDDALRQLDLTRDQLAYDVIKGDTGVTLKVAQEIGKMKGWTPEFTEDLIRQYVENLKIFNTSEKGFVVIPKDVKENLMQETADQLIDSMGAPSLDKFGIQLNKAEDFVLDAEPNSVWMQKKDVAAAMYASTKEHLNMWEEIAQPLAGVPQNELPGILRKLESEKLALTQQLLDAQNADDLAIQSYHDLSGMVKELQYGVPSWALDAAARLSKPKLIKAWKDSAERLKNQIEHLLNPLNSDYSPYRASGLQKELADTEAGLKQILKKPTKQEAALAKQIEELQEAWSGGVADFGDPNAAIAIQHLKGYEQYKNALKAAIEERYGKTVTVYRVMSPNQLAEWQSGADMPAMGVSVTKRYAEGFKNFALNEGKDLVAVEFDAPSDAIIMLGKGEEAELVIDANKISFHQVRKMAPSNAENINAQIATLVNTPLYKAAVAAVHRIPRARHDFEQAELVFKANTGKLYFAEPVKLAYKEVPIAQSAEAAKIIGHFESKEAAIKAYTQQIADLEEDFAWFKQHPTKLKEAFEETQKLLTEYKRELDIITTSGTKKIPIYLNKAGQEIFPSPVPLKNIPVTRFHDAPLTKERRLGSHFTYSHLDKSIYKRPVGGPKLEGGGKFTTHLNVSPKNPYIVRLDHEMTYDTSGGVFPKKAMGEGATIHALREFIGADTLRRYEHQFLDAKRFKGTLYYAALKPLVTKQELANIVKTADQLIAGMRGKGVFGGTPDAGLARFYPADVLAAAIGRSKGYDALISVDAKGRGLNEIFLIDKIATQVSNGVIPNIFDKIKEVSDLAKQIPLKFPDELMSAVIAQKVAQDDIWTFESKLGAGTPYLADLKHSYLFHMTTKNAKKQIVAALEASIGKRKWDPSHASMLTRKLRDLSIDEANKLYQGDGIKLKGVVIKATKPGEKLFETDLKALEYFRRMRAQQFAVQVNLARDVARRFAKDISVRKAEALETAKELRKVYREKINLAAQNEDLQSVHDLEKALAKEIHKLRDGIIPKGYVPLAFVGSKDPRYKNLIPYFKNLYFKEEIAKPLNKYIQYSTDPLAAGGFLDAIGKLRINWVLATMYLPPGAVPTLIKNFVGNTFNNSLAGLHPTNFKMYGHAKDIILHALGKSGDPDAMITIGKHTLRKSDIVQELHNMGIFGGGYGPEEVLRFLTEHGGEKPWIARSKTLNKWLRVGPTIEMMQKAYRVTEDWARAAHYIFKRYGDEALSPFEARASVKKYLFDYVYGYTDFDRKLRIFMPFLNWTRNNLPLQLSSLLENPIKPTYVQLAHGMSLARDRHSAQRVDGFHRNVLPDWVRENVGIPVQEGEDGNPEYLLFGSWIPAAELESLTSRSGVFRKLAGLIGPYAKIPVEQAFNFDLFLQRKITEYPGETQDFFGHDVHRRLVHFAKIFRVAADLDRFTKGELDNDLPPEAKSVLARAIQGVFGLRTIRMNLPANEAKRQQKIREIKHKIAITKNPANREALMEYLQELLDYER